MLENIRTDMTDAFKVVSTGVLKENNESFLDLAKTTLSKYIDASKTDLDARNKAVQNVVQPLKETLDKYDQHVSTMERDREKALGGLTKHIETLTSSQNELQKETGKLVGGGFGVRDAEGFRMEPGIALHPPMTKEERAQIPWR